MTNEIIVKETKITVLSINEQDYIGITDRLKNKARIFYYRVVAQLQYL